MRTYKTARLLGGTSGEPKGYMNVCGKHSVPQSPHRAQAPCDDFVPLRDIALPIIARLTVVPSSKEAA
jgi:hypothetical protein